jgi:hypothetical protein
MRALASERGVSRGVAAPAIAVAVLAVALIAGEAVLAHYTDPSSVSQKLEDALGVPVTVGDVEVSPIRLKAILKNVELGPRTTLRSAAVRFDLASLVSREWSPREVALSRPVWTVPASAGEMEPFLKGALLPLWLADRASSVTIDDGALLAGDRKTELCSELNGRFSRTSGAGPSHGVELNLRGIVARCGEVSAEGRYSKLEGADSANVENLILSCAGRKLELIATVTWSAPSKIGAELASADFCGGSAEMSVRLREGPPGGTLVVHADLDGCDGARLLGEGVGLDVLESGALSAGVDARADLSDLGRFGLGGFEATCTVEVTNAVLSPSGPVAEVLPLASGAGGRLVESAAARVAVSRAAVVIQNMTVACEGITWNVVGRVGRDRSLAGVVVGRVPAEMIRGDGTAVSLVKAMLADRGGVIPAAFKVGGSLDDPRVHFDVERTAEEAAAGGRPQARQLLKAMSRSDIERLNRKVDELLGGLTLH